MLRRALNDKILKRAQFIIPTPKTYEKFLKEFKKATSYYRRDRNLGFLFGGFLFKDKGKGKDKDAMDIDAITATRASGLLFLRAILNLVSAYGYELEGNDSNDSYDSRVFYLSEDFEKTLERRYYGDGLGY